MSEELKLSRKLVWKEVEDDLAVSPDDNDVVLVSPRGGMMHVDEVNEATEHFRLYTLHTNFPLTKGIMQEIETTAGVEILIGITRYRCRVGFPNVETFDASNTQAHIEQRINRAIDFSPRNVQLAELYSCDISVVQKFTEASEYLRVHYPYWAVCLFPSGQIDHICAGSMNPEFRDKFNDYQNAEEHVGAKLISFLNDKDSTARL